MSQKSKAKLILNVLFHLLMIKSIQESFLNDLYVDIIKKQYFEKF